MTQSHVTKTTANRLGFSKQTQTKAALQDLITISTRKGFVILITVCTVHSAAALPLTPIRRNQRWSVLIPSLQSRKSASFLYASIFKLLLRSECFPFGCFPPRPSKKGILIRADQERKP